MKVIFFLECKRDGEQSIERKKMYFSLRYFLCIYIFFAFFHVYDSLSQLYFSQCFLLFLYLYVYFYVFPVPHNIIFQAMLSNVLCTFVFHKSRHIYGIKLFMFVYLFGLCTEKKKYFSLRMKTIFPFAAKLFSYLVSFLAFQREQVPPFLATTY